RAIAVNTGPMRSDSIAPAPAPVSRFSMMPTLRPLLARSVAPPRLRRPLLALAFAGATLAVGSLWLPAPGKAPSVGASAVSPMVDLNPARSAAVRPALAPSAAPAPSASVGATAVASGKRARPPR
ncbi:MAG TPA: hypothetical protein VER04_13160, partial [Polyangiaceae bacterium]|nr:hypothetical protein [Polyangiaceae bacterium]